MPPNARIARLLRPQATSTVCSPDDRDIVSRRNFLKAVAVLPAAVSAARAAGQSDEAPPETP
ncbi:MAG: twin-arginine translocation signal domain-containing protein [Verrucomicrobia bacterium]|nr:twin-arginine translocation signal domain-containing protein [Verrucomicrobiota bacterium]